LGVPLADRGQCWDLLNTAVPPPSPQADPHEQRAMRQRAAAASAQLGEYFTTLVEQRRAAPADDFISACLTDDGATGEVWTSRELALALLPVFGSGVGTLSDTVGNAVHTLLSRPGELARLAADPASAAAEIVRYCGAYHVTRRYASREIDVGGTTVVEGSAVVLVLGAANRDGERFPNPDEFDPQRAAAGSLGFGAGIHYCLGAALAKVVLEELCRAASDVGALRLAGAPQWRASLLFFGPVTLPVQCLDQTSRR
jgi:cytochrome P450 hydroxylase